MQAPSRKPQHASLMQQSPSTAAVPTARQNSHNAPPLWHQPQRTAKHVLHKGGNAAKPRRTCSYHRSQHAHPQLCSHRVSIPGEIAEATHPPALCLGWEARRHGYPHMKRDMRMTCQGLQKTPLTVRSLYAQRKKKNLDHSKLPHTWFLIQNELSHTRALFLAKF